MTLASHLELTSAHRQSRTSVSRVGHARGRVGIIPLCAAIADPAPSPLRRADQAVRVGLRVHHPWLRLGDLVRADNAEIPARTLPTRGPADHRARQGHHTDAHLPEADCGRGGRSASMPNGANLRPCPAPSAAPSSTARDRRESSPRSSCHRPRSPHPPSPRPHSPCRRGSPPRWSPAGP